MKLSMRVSTCIFGLLEDFHGPSANKMYKLQRISPTTFNLLLHMDYRQLVKWEWGVNDEARQKTSARNEYHPRQERQSWKQNMRFKHFLDPSQELQISQLEDCLSFPKNWTVKCLRLLLKLWHLLSKQMPHLHMGPETILVGHAQVWEAHWCRVSGGIHFNH